MGNAAILFGPFCLEPDNSRLLRDGSPVALGHRALALLHALAEAKGQLLTKSELMERVWPGQIVEEGNLTVQIAALRKAMGADSEGRDFIVTVPREGYRLIGGTVASPARQPNSVRPALAVLAFQNLSGDPEQEYFADGIVEDIITALSRFKSFAVIARNSSFAYRGKALDPRQVANELGVRYVLEGSVRRGTNRLRITAQLVDAMTGAQLWAQNFDSPAEDVFDVQDRITASVAAIIEPKIQQAEIDRSRRERPESLEAYDLYLRASQLLNTFRADANAAAIELLEKAMSMEPASAPVLAQAIYAYEHRCTMGWAPVSANDGARAIELVRSALAVARDDALLLVRCGFAIQAIERDFDQGLILVTRAVALNPHNVEVLFVAGAVHIWCGSLDEALRLFKRVIELSPGDTVNAYAGLAHVNIALGHYQEALEWAGRSYAENPNFDVIHWLLIAANAHLGRMEEARRWLRALQALSPGVTMASIQSGNTQKEPGRMAAIFDGLRKAGMPERPPEMQVLPSLAVLPFQNLSGDAEQEYFADGIVEDIITALSRFKSFAVIARNSSFVYKGRAVDVRQVAHDLGVRYVLEGSVRRAGSTLRISAQLVDGETGSHLWAQKYDGAAEDIFDMQDRIAESVVALVEPKIQRAEIERSRRERPESFGAYDLYLRALSDVYASRPEANAKAIALLERVITLDPNFAPAAAMAAQAYLLRVVMQFDGADGSDAERAIALARAALALTRDDPMVVAYGGFVLLQIAREYETGLALLRLAASENPNSAAILNCSGIGSLMAGDLTEAADYLQRALRLEPNGFGTHWQLTGMAHIRMAEGRYEEALNWATRSQAINPGYDATHWMLIAANAYLGRMEEARKYLSALEKISPGVNLSRIRRGQRALDPHRIDVLIEGMRVAGLPEV
jgi:TolB-like protein/Tfp pilus assembly protein PilF